VIVCERFETDGVKKFDGSFCLLPKETGPCKAYMERFFYDQETRSCQKFVYGGCHGKKYSNLLI
jgi:hypothetical protein